MSRAIVYTVFFSPRFNFGNFPYCSISTESDSLLCWKRLQTCIIALESKVFDKRENFTNELLSDFIVSSYNGIHSFICYRFHWNSSIEVDRKHGQVLLKDRSHFTQRNKEWKSEISQIYN